MLEYSYRPLDYQHHLGNNMLLIEKKFTIKHPSVAKGIVQGLLEYYNTKDVRKSVEGGKIVVKAILVGPYAL